MVERVIHCCAILLTYASLVHGASDTDPPFRRVCVFRSWLHWYGFPRGPSVEVINASLCSHIVYDGAGLIDNRLVSHDWEDDDSHRGLGQITKIVNMRKQGASLKVIISLGGSQFRWRYISTMMRLPVNRHTFIESSMAYIQKRQLDGLHLDFYFPQDAIGSSSDDRQGFIRLIQELRAKFESESSRTGSPRLELSVSVSCRRSVIDRSYNIRSIVGKLDWISLRAFDFNEDNEGMTVHQAPLFVEDDRKDGPREQNINWAVNYWLDAGVVKSKMVVGISFSAVTYELTSARILGFWSPQTGVGPPGKHTMLKGRLSYYEVCEYLNEGAPRMWSNIGAVPYAIYDGWLWIGYDDPKSLAIKLAWIRASNLGGWKASHFVIDDYHGSFCGQGKYPLLSTLNGYTVTRYEETQTNESSKSDKMRSPGDILLLTAVVCMVENLAFAPMR